MAAPKILLSIIDELVSSDTPMKITFSKARLGHKLVNSYIDSINQDEATVYKVVDRSDTQDFTSILRKDQLVEMVDQKLNNEFYFVDLFSSKGDYSLMQSSKGKQTLIEKKSSTAIASGASHNHEKKYLIKSDLPFLHHLGITSATGEVYASMQKKYRQINKYVEVFSAFLDKLPMKLVIADMGSGKGYLTFALYHYLTQNKGREVDITGYEIREDLIESCNTIARKCRYDGLHFVQGSLDIIAPISTTNVVIALHACDIATDMAIDKAIGLRAELILISPCCHKQVRKQMTTKDGITAYGILEERQAEIITDAIRALIMEERGYDTKVFEFIDTEHTSKNLMISAQYSGNKMDHQQEIQRIKAMYGIKEHYLEKLVKVKH